MNKKYIKIMFSVLLILILLSIIHNNVYAAYSISDLPGKEFTNQEAIDVGNKTVTIVTTIGSVLSVIVLIVLGLKYMLGSIEEKAIYKKTLMPYIIGAGLVFGANVIAGVFYSVITNL